MLEIDTCRRGLELLAAGAAAEALPLLKAVAQSGGGSPDVLVGVALATEQSLGSDVAGPLYRALPLLFPEWDEAALILAEFMRRTGDLSGAERAFAATLEINPNRFDALLGLGDLLIRRNRGRDAQIPLLRACGVAPEHPAAWNSLGLAFAANKDFGIAATAFFEAQRREPGNYEYALRRVEAAWRSGRFDPEIALLEREASLAPLDPVLLTARGVLLSLDGRLLDAADALEAAHTLAPNDDQPAMQFAITLMRLDRNQAAVPLLRRLHHRHPGNSKLANDLAVCLMRSHWHAEAAAILKESLAREWTTATACNLAITLLWQGQQPEAAALARRAIAADPGATQPRRVLCNIIPYAEGETGASALAAARQCAATLARPPHRGFTAKDPKSRLRIGLLSDLLRSHPAGWLTVAGFEALDPARFEIFVFGRDAGDTIARRVAAISAEWVKIDAMNNAELTAAIRSRSIDILIDLGGWGDHGRIDVCSHRPAPVQMKWVGSQNHSSGIAEIDWIISDRWETPPDQAGLYSERLLILPNGYVCYSPPPYAPDVGPLPMLASGAVTFGCFNNLAKITDGAIAIWSRILHEIPGARIMFKTHQLSEASSREMIQAKFHAQGIDPSRLILEGRSPHREFLDAYNHIDIALDPFPYSGGLGTCEALWMGVPTITLPGDTFASRHSMSHLCNAGLDDWVAANSDAYVSMAIEKQCDTARLAEVRSGLRARVKASPLCDAPRFGRDLGKALQDCWIDLTEVHSPS